ncbi:hypothetical protein [Oleiagrimonas soli]|uniref:Uncharacterized protein n=1 Tax=Oleiagrimonas soli TaxID=1543381 RepID=A0A841KFE9_9GAMM|nr:hypothetical protein [Oleiagrimonas soli]MBB6183922.1 hypothetical protein [Oleiagrimonas soli]
MIVQGGIGLSAGIDVIDMVAAFTQAGAQSGGNGGIVFSNQNSQCVATLPGDAMGNRG